MPELPLEAYRTLLVKTLDPIPKSLPALAELAKVIHDDPKLASYNYAIILDISEPTFFRNVKLLRANRIIRPTTYRLTDEAISQLGSEGESNTYSIEDVIKTRPSTGWIEDYVISVAKRGLREEEKKKLAEGLAAIPPDRLNEAMGIFALFSLSRGREAIYKDKELSGEENLTTVAFVNKLREQLNPKPVIIETPVIEKKVSWWEVIKDMPPDLQLIVNDWNKENNYGRGKREPEEFNYSTSVTRSILEPEPPSSRYYEDADGLTRMRKD